MRNISNFALQWPHYNRPLMFSVVASVGGRQSHKQQSVTSQTRHRKVAGESPLFRVTSCNFHYRFQVCDKIWYHCCRGKAVFLINQTCISSSSSLLLVIRCSVYNKAPLDVRSSRTYAECSEREPSAISAFKAVQKYTRSSRCYASLAYAPLTFPAALI